VFQIFFLAEQGGEMVRELRRSPIQLTEFSDERIHREHVVRGGEPQREEDAPTLPVPFKKHGLPKARYRFRVDIENPTTEW